MYSIEFCKSEMVESAVMMALSIVWVIAMAILTIVALVSDSVYFVGFGIFAFLGIMICSTSWDSYKEMSKELDWHIENDKTE